MTIRHLIDILQTMNADADVVVALFSADGTSEIFAIEDVTNTNGNAHIEIYASPPRNTSPRAYTEERKQ
jgi:hypothetical protein